MDPKNKPSAAPDSGQAQPRLSRSATGLSAAGGAGSTAGVKSLSALYAAPYVPMSNFQHCDLLLKEDARHRYFKLHAMKPGLCHTDAEIKLLKRFYLDVAYLTDTDLHML